MASIDLSSYNDLFITNARNCIDTINKNVILFSLSANEQEKKTAISEIFRMIHMLKSQSAFMGYSSTAGFCLILEKIFYVIKNNVNLLTADKLSEFKQAFTLLTSNIQSITEQKKELDFSESLNKFAMIYKEHYEDSDH